MAGLEFTRSEGVRLQELRTITYRKNSGFREFMDFVYETAKIQGGEFCVSNVNESFFVKRLSAEFLDFHIKRMSEITDLCHYKILVKQGDTNFVSSNYAEYRWVQESKFHPVPFYVFGDNLAFLIFGEETNIHLISNADIADAQRTQFNYIWDNALIPNQ